MKYVVAVLIWFGIVGVGNGLLLLVLYLAFGTGEGPEWVSAVSLLWGMVLGAVGTFTAFGYLESR
jgi:ABC-type transport system involved in multi-copper enzyme maturation permease subunit